MNRSTRMAVAITVAVVLAAPALRAAETNIAVLDVTRIFEEYEMTRDLEELFETARRAIADEADQRRKDLEQMRRGLSAFDPSSEDFTRRENDMMRSEIDFQVWSAYKERELKASHKAWLMRIYENTQRVVSEIAADKKLDLVLTYDRLAQDAPDSATLRQQILLQKVIYHSERVDITQEVLTRLNEGYQAHGGIRSIDAFRAGPPVSGKPTQEPAKQQP